MELSFDSPANFGIVSHRPVRRLCSILPRLARLQLQKEESMKNIFVGNLSFGTSEETLRSMFAAYGAVDRVNIVTDRDSGQPRGFAFIEMSVDSEGNNAINALNGKDVDGRALNINEARPKGDRAPSHGGQRRTNRW